MYLYPDILYLRFDAVSQWCLRKLLGIICGMTRWDGQATNHTFQLLSKHGVSPCSATLHECQAKQMLRRS